MGAGRRARTGSSSCELQAAMRLNSLAVTASNTEVAMVAVMSDREAYTPSAQAEAFLSSVQNGKYNRQIITGLGKFMGGNVPEDMRALYSEQELRSLMELKGTVRDVEARMPVKVTRHYFELAKHSRPLQTLIKASPRETEDLTGAPDPGKQMDF